MGSWGVNSLENDSSLDFKAEIMDILGVGDSDLDSSNCEVLNNKEMKYSFKTLLPSLLNKARVELQMTDMADCAHTIVQFIVQNNVKISNKCKAQLTEMLMEENFSCWRKPEERKNAVNEVIKELNKIC